MDKLVYLAAGCDDRLAGWLSEREYIVRTISTSGIVETPVSCHPDMFMCKLGAVDNAPVVCSGQADVFPGSHTASSDADERGRLFLESATKLLPPYPHDIAFNAACTGRYFIHNTRYTAPELLAYAEHLGMSIINVRQGYAKCSTVIVDEDSIITYDRGIERACREEGMNTLLVSSGHIILPGYNTGFIGGTSGRAGDTVVFNGDLTSHPDFTRICDFIADRGLRTKWFEEWPLIDIGSIITLTMSDEATS